MKIGGIVLFVGMLAGALCPGCGRSRQAPEPSYRGRPLGAWLQELPEPTPNQPKGTEAVEAIRAMGTNALPFMLRAMAAGYTNETAWRAVYGFYWLRDVARPAVS